MFAEALNNTWHRKRSSRDLCLLCCSSRPSPPDVSRAALQILIAVNRGAELEKRWRQRVLMWRWATASSTVITKPAADRKEKQLEGPETGPEQRAGTVEARSPCTPLEQMAGRACAGVRVCMGVTVWTSACAAVSAEPISCSRLDEQAGATRRSRLLRSDTGWEQFSPYSPWENQPFLVISALKMGSCYYLSAQVLGERSPGLSQDTHLSPAPTPGGKSGVFNQLNVENLEQTYTHKNILHKAHNGSKPWPLTRKSAWHQWKAWLMRLSHCSCIPASEAWAFFSNPS